MHRTTCLLGLAAVAAPLSITLSSTLAQPFDFSAVTALANGALVGENVGSPVPGFDLLLMKDGVVDLVVEVKIGDAGEGRDGRRARGEERASGAGGRGTAELQSEQPPGLTASNPESL